MKFLKKFSSQQEKDDFDAIAQNKKYISLVSDYESHDSMGFSYLDWLQSSGHTTNLSGLYYDWVQNDGQSYIDTNIIADDNTRIEMKVWTNNVGTFSVVGSRVSLNGDIVYGIGGSQNDKKILFSVNGVETNTSVVRNDDSGNTFTFKLETNGDGTYNSYIKNEDTSEEYVADNVSYGTIESNDKHIFIFGNGFDIINGNTKIYYLKIYKNGKLVGYFKPYKNITDSSVGMFNVSDLDIYANNGQGMLIIGNDEIV